MIGVRDSLHSLSSSPSLCTRVDWLGGFVHRKVRKVWSLYSYKPRVGWLKGLSVCVKPIFIQTLVVDVGEKDGVCCVFILGKGVVPVLGLGTICYGFGGTRGPLSKSGNHWLWRVLEEQYGPVILMQPRYPRCYIVGCMDYGHGGAKVLLSMLIASCSQDGWWSRCQFLVMLLLGMSDTKWKWIWI